MVDKPLRRFDPVADSRPYQWRASKGSASRRAPARTTRGSASVRPLLHAHTRASSKNSCESAEGRQSGKPLWGCRAVPSEDAGFAVGQFILVSRAKSPQQFERLFLCCSRFKKAPSYARSATGERGSSKIDPLPNTEGRGPFRGQDRPARVSNRLTTAHAPLDPPPYSQLNELGGFTYLALNALRLPAIGEGDHEIPRYLEPAGSGCPRPSRNFCPSLIVYNRFYRARGIIS